MPRLQDEHIFFPKAKWKNIITLQEVRPHIYHSSFKLEGFPFADRLDWYVIVEPGERALFIDTGAWELIGTNVLDETVKHFNLKWSQIEIFMTHFHIDHEQSLQYCLARGANTIYCGPQNTITVEQIKHWGQITGASQAGDHAVVELVISVGNRLSETSIPHKEIVVSENDFIEIADYQFRPIYTPGHTAEHVCLFETNQRFLFGGDHIIESAPGIMQWVENDHILQRYLETFPRIKSMRPQGVYMSHHEAFKSQSEVINCIDNIVDSYNNPLTKIYKILRKSNKPLTAYQVAKNYYANRPNGLRYFIDDLRCRKVANIFGYLEYLYDTSEINRVQDSSGAFIYSIN